MLDKFYVNFYEALTRYNNQCAVTETVSKPKQVLCQDGNYYWKVTIRRWSLD